MLVAIVAILILRPPITKAAFVKIFATVVIRSKAIAALVAIHGASGLGAAVQCRVAPGVLSFFPEGRDAPGTSFVGGDESGEGEGDGCETHFLIMIRLL